VESIQVDGSLIEQTARFSCRARNIELRTRLDEIRRLTELCVAIEAEDAVLLRPRPVAFTGHERPRPGDEIQRQQGQRS
jgi:hypothetical protein